MALICAARSLNGHTLGRQVPALVRLSSSWASVPMGPADPILGLSQAFNDDPHPDKVILGVGAYRDGMGKPYVLDSVRKAEQAIVDAHMNKEYLGIAGHPGFISSAVKLMLGNKSAPIEEKRLAAVQTLSGTGGCRLVGEFYARFLGHGTPLLLPAPSWANHANIFRDSGLSVRTYRYWDPDTCGLDVHGMLSDLAQAEDGSIVLLHACAHNPTGVDPTLDEWKEISRVCASRRHRVFFDAAYQGFASGDAEKDASAVRMFIEDGHHVALCQSFAKNFGLYGERVGCLSLVCSDADEATRVESQLKALIRPMYSNPPVHGARIVAHILEDEVRSAPAPRRATPTEHVVQSFIAGPASPVEGGVQGHGRPHHLCPECPPQRAGAPGVCKVVAARDGPDRHVLLLRAFGGAGPQAQERLPHLCDEGREDQHGGRHNGQRDIPRGEHSRRYQLRYMCHKSERPPRRRPQRGRTRRVCISNTFLPSH